MTFLLGLILGGLSGGITYGLTTDATAALIVGAIATVLTWCGLATILIADD